MIRTILGVILAIVASAAMATGNNGGTNCNGNGSCGTNNNYNTTNAPQGGKAEANSLNVNSNKNTNVQGQKQGQAQGQLQGQAQGQQQSATASNNGNAQSTNVTINEGSTPKQATPGPGIASSPSATCRIAVGASVGGTFGGVGAFGSIEDERCADMERGRYMAEVLGRRDAAKALACQDEKMAKALGDCEKGKVATTTAGMAATDGRDPFRNTGE